MSEKAREIDEGIKNGSGQSLCRSSTSKVTEDERSEGMRRDVRGEGGGRGGDYPGFSKRIRGSPLLFFSSPTQGTGLRTHPEPRQQTCAPVSAKLSCSCSAGRSL